MQKEAKGGYYSTEWKLDFNQGKPRVLAGKARCRHPLLVTAQRRLKYFGVRRNDGWWPSQERTARYIPRDTSSTTHCTLDSCYVGGLTSFVVEISWIVILRTLVCNAIHASTSTFRASQLDRCVQAKYR